MTDVQTRNAIDRIIEHALTPLVKRIEALEAERKGCPQMIKGGPWCVFPWCDCELDEKMSDLRRAANTCPNREAGR